MFSKNRSRLASALFDGDDITQDFTVISNDLQFKYWNKLINKHSRPFNQSFDYNNTNSNTATMQLITIEEVTSCYVNLNDRAPGVDRIKKCDLVKIGLINITSHFNIYLLSLHAPSAFKLDLTILMDKNKQSNEPSHYRPITMSSIICRLLHKISQKDGIKVFVRRDTSTKNMHA